MQTATQEKTPEQQPVIDPGKMARAAQRASELMKTLGHKDRLMVLCHLTSGEKSVGELARLLDIPQSPLSQHLARMRKENLVTYGFRLPSALDNRPLRFEEWEARAPQMIFCSATPRAYELDKTGGEVVEQVVRPTGLVDPAVEVRPV